MLRTFKWYPLILVLVAIFAFALGCGASEPEVVVKEVIKTVEVPVEKVVEKVVVKEVPKIVEKIVVATPLPITAGLWMINLAGPETKFGGSLVRGSHGPMSHFDLFASGSISNVGPQAPMYDQLVRVNPQHPSAPVVGDLAYRWEVSPDGLTYIFNIRDGVKFHDGTDLTSEDIVASLNRIMFPETYQEGLRSGQRAVFEGAVKDITASDDFTVQLRLSEGRSFEYLMGGLSRGFNVITTKEVLEQNKGDLAKIDNYPGTGPYVYQSRDSEKFVLENNPNYWNPNAGFLDTLTHVYMRAYSAEMVAALDGGVVDFADYVAPKGWKSFQSRPDGSMTFILSGLVQSIMINSGNPPTDDPRVQKAFALVIDGPALRTMAEDVITLFRTGWFDFGAPLSRSADELDKVPGLRSPTEADIARAKQLLNDAGFPDCKGMPVLEIPTRDAPEQRVWIPAIQAMLKQTLGCESKTAIHQTSAIAPLIQEGKWNVAWSSFGSRGLAGSAGGATRWRCGAPNNVVNYCNPEFDKLANAYMVETDAAMSAELKRKIRDTWDEDLPWVPFGESPVPWVWYDHVKGMPTFNVVTFEKNLHKLDWVWTTRK